MKPRFDRSRRNPAQNRDFAYSEAPNIVESDRLPLFLRQRLNRAPQHLVDFLGLVDDLGRWFLIFERECGNGFPANKSCAYPFRSSRSR